MVATKDPIFRKKPVSHVPRHLIYEIMDGKPIYYKGYWDVLSGKKTASEIMGITFNIGEYLTKKGSIYA